MFYFGNRLTAISTASVAAQHTLPDIAHEYHEQMPGFGMNVSNATRRFEFGSANFLDPFEPPLTSLVIHHHIHVSVSPWFHD